MDEAATRHANTRLKGSMRTAGSGGRFGTRAALMAPRSPLILAQDAQLMISFREGNTPSTKFGLDNLSEDGGGAIEILIAIVAKPYLRVVLDNGVEPFELSAADLPILQDALASQRAGRNLSGRYGAELH